MEKVYLVIEEWSEDTTGKNINVFRKYEDAKAFFEKEKELFSYQVNCRSKQEEDYYCEWGRYCDMESGEYIYFHDEIRIEEKKVK